MYEQPHEPGNFFWAASSDRCPHEPEPERHTDAWDLWMCNHQISDNGTICLSAPAGEACLGCSQEDGDMVPWEACRVREHTRPENGVTPNPGVQHQEIPVWVGTQPCLERDCDDYYNDDGDDDPAITHCSHIRKEIACSCQRGPDGEYGSTPCPALTTA